MGDAVALNLSRAFEDRLLAAPARAGARRVPAVVVTGFLGSGKTTLLRSLLARRCNLRFALIQNEFGADVDSSLLGDAGANAACGLPLLSVADACACCDGAAALRAAVRAVLPAAADVDALFVEATGLADPAPLAAALAAEGAALECVVCVVDAEAAAAQLAAPTAATLHAQLRVADIVALNKCDLVSLGALSELEDALARLTRARIIRCRHGAVPLPALLDVREAPLPAATECTGGVVSHESSRSGAETRFVMAEAPASGSRKRRLEECERAEAPPHQPHALQLQRISTVTWRAPDDAPVCAAAFAAWLLRDAAPAKSLLRAKGQLFLAQSRRARHVFHFSGARRVEALQELPWEGPPATTVVLIGTNRAELLALRDRLAAATEQQASRADDEAAAAAAAFAALLAADARFEVAEPPAAAAHAKDRRGFVDFGLRGMPHKGVEGGVLNCTLLRRMNGGAATAEPPSALLWGLATRQPDRMSRLRIAFGGADAAAAAHASLLLHADAVLRDALAHIGLCNCG